MRGQLNKHCEKNMKQSASKVALQNIEICKSMSAAEISLKFADIFSNTLSRSNFIKVLYKNGIDFDKMNYLENSTEFTIIDRYSKGAPTTQRIHNLQINERDINNKFYPFCTEVYVSKKEIHVIPCDRVTPLVKIIK